MRPATLNLRRRLAGGLGGRAVVSDRVHVSRLSTGAPHHTSVARPQPGRILGDVGALGGANPHAGAPSRRQPGGQQRPGAGAHLPAFSARRISPKHRDPARHAVYVRGQRFGQRPAGVAGYLPRPRSVGRGRWQRRPGHLASGAGLAYRRDNGPFRRRLTAAADVSACPDAALLPHIDAVSESNRDVGAALQTTRPRVAPGIEDHVGPANRPGEGGGYDGRGHPRRERD